MTLSIRAREKAVRGVVYGAPPGHCRLTPGSLPAFFGVYYRASLASIPATGTLPMLGAARPPRWITHLFNEKSIFFSKTDHFRFKT